MQCNIGKYDRTLRVVVGLGLIAYGLYAQNWLGAIGIIPLLTAYFKFCPAYVPFKINTGAE